jgi:recombination protein RecT
MSEATDTTQARAELQALNDAPPVTQAVDLIRRNRSNFVALLGGEDVAEQFTTAFLTEFRNSPELMECDPYSVVGGMRTAAQYRLPFGPQGYVYLMPRRIKNQWQAIFVLGYTGIAELARRGGAEGLRATVIWSDDEWSGIKNVNGSLRYTHAAKFEHDEKAERVGVLVEWREGTTRNAIECPPSRIDEALKASGLSDNSRRDKDWYWRKTAVRFARPWLPQSPKMDSLAAALEQDEQPAEALDELPDDDA